MKISHYFPTASDKQGSSKTIRYSVSKLSFVTIFSNFRLLEYLQTSVCQQYFQTPACYSFFQSPVCYSILKLPSVTDSGLVKLPSVADSGLFKLPSVTNCGLFKLLSVTMFLNLRMWSRSNTRVFQSLSKGLSYSIFKPLKYEWWPFTPCFISPKTSYTEQQFPKFLYTSSTFSKNTYTPRATFLQPIPQLLLRKIWHLVPNR